MRLLMIGLNHRTSDVALRERLALSGDRLQEALAALREQYPHAEATILSTCNRTELYVARPGHRSPTAEELIAFLARITGVDIAQLTSALIRREQDQVVAHLFGVCAGLDSMVLGEPQILGQVKRAYEQAAEAQVVGVVLHRVFQEAIRTAKRARHQTDIGRGNASIGSAAVHFAKRIFDHFEDKTILAIGAGEMAKLTLRHFKNLGPSRLLLTNRTIERAQRLAEMLDLDGAVRPYENLDELIVEADIIVTSTGSAQPILTEDRFKPLLKRRRFRPLFIIDIAVPRDVETAVGGLTNVYLYNIDDLEMVVTQAYQERAEQVQAAVAIVRESASRCLAAVRHQDIGKVIRALRSRLTDIGEAETQRTLRKLATSDPDATASLIEEHTRRVVNKILHLPLGRLAPHNEDAPHAFYAAAIRQLFELDEACDAHTTHDTHDTPDSNDETNAPDNQDTPSETQPKPKPGIDTDPLIYRP